MTIQLSDSEKLSNSFKMLLSKIYPDIRSKQYSLYTVYFDSVLVSSSDEAQEQINSWIEEIYPNEDCIVHLIQDETDSTEATPGNIMTLEDEKNN